MKIKEYTTELDGDKKNILREVGQIMYLEYLKYRMGVLIGQCVE